MATDTTCRLAGERMLMMLRHCKDIGTMTLCTDGIITRVRNIVRIKLQHFAAVRVMAIATAYPGIVHLALQERSVHKDFFTNLPVNEVLRLSDQLRIVLVCECTVFVVCRHSFVGGFSKRMTQTMATRAGAQVRIVI